ncbi:unnamed protein product [Symbiodinium natans]|uniref:Secreted protein n=1 Tax=Symbiodinium natans TaxID=878477 RepID=A0A812MBQ8_9DINO|nr:unnamed protein product [Symbiodinium natans]
MVFFFFAWAVQLHSVALCAQVRVSPRQEAHGISRGMVHTRRFLVPFHIGTPPGSLRASCQMSEKDREGWAKLLQGGGSCVQSSSFERCGPRGTLGVSKPEGGGMSSVSEALAEPPSFATPFPRLPPARPQDPG